MNRNTLLLLLATTCATPALAADPKPCADDARIQCIEYKRSDIVRVYMASGASFRIELHAGDEIDGVVVSDQRTLAHEEEEQSSNPLAASSAPQPQRANPDDPVCDANLCQTRVGNLFYLMPRRELSPQPFFFRATWKDATGREHSDPYAFEIQTRAPRLAAGQKVAANGTATNDASPEPTYYGVRFTYPAREAEARKIEASVKATAWRAAHPPMPKIAPPSPSLPTQASNYSYAYRGAPEIKPDRVWDDGRSTFIHFNGNRRIPNVYGFLPDGTETNGIGIASEPDATGTTLRIGKTDRRWCLRDGDRAGCLLNASGDPEGRSVATVRQ